MFPQLISSHQAQICMTLLWNRIEGVWYDGFETVFFCLYKTQRHIFGQNIAFCILTTLSNFWLFIYWTQKIEGDSLCVWVLNSPWLLNRKYLKCFPHLSFALFLFQFSAHQKQLPCPPSPLGNLTLLRPYQAQTQPSMRFNGVLAQWAVVDWSNYLQRVLALTMVLERETNFYQLNLSL